MLMVKLEGRKEDCEGCVHVCISEESSSHIFGSAMLGCWWVGGEGWSGSGGVV